VILILGTIILLCLAFMSPWPKWLFWAAALALAGVVFPLALGALILFLVLKGMGALWGATRG
jgi:hypothetical protein